MLALAFSSKPHRAAGMAVDSEPCFMILTTEHVGETSTITTTTTLFYYLHCKIYN